jgi:hypothetical protein
MFHSSDFNRRFLMKGEYVPASANVVFMIATNASIRLFSFSCKKYRSRFRRRSLWVPELGWALFYTFYYV